MPLGLLDLAVIAAFFGLVVALGLTRSRRKADGAQYFLAGRTLRWWLIGVSIVAANISTEQFVGMSGSAAGNVGLAVAGYQLLGIVAITFAGLVFLPRFLRAGIYTLPEYLEYRYCPAARSIMAAYTMVIYVAVSITAVLFSGALTLHTIFGIRLTGAVWMIGGVAALYTAWGGLSAVVWADLIQGGGLLVGGLVTLGLGLRACGGLERFLEASADKLHMVLPADHPELPWTALVIGLWIPNLYYCGVNQFIVQRTLAARSLKEGQLGILFAGLLWLLVPFAIVMPGIVAWQLYGDQLSSPDRAYPVLVRHVVPAGLRGFILAALAGAVISSLASLLNSAATIFTIDLYKRHWVPDASPRAVVVQGRIMTVVFMLIGCLIAPNLTDPRFGGVFRYIQEFQGYISPGILAAFVFGFAVRRAPAAAGIAALVLTAPVYGFLHWRFGQIAFLNRMAITFVVILAIMTVITVWSPQREPKALPVRTDFPLVPSRRILALSAALVAGVAAFYIVFW